MLNGSLVNLQAYLNMNTNVTYRFLMKAVDQAPSTYPHKMGIKRLDQQIVCQHFIADTLQILLVLKAGPISLASFKE